MATDNRKVIEDYEKVWGEWRLTGNLKQTIQDHLATRGRFLEILDGIVSGVREGSRIIELGCGTAIDIGVLSRKHPGKIFMASDLSRNAARLARDVSADFGHSFHVFAGDIQHLPLSADSVDVVFSQGVMEHFKDPLPFFKEQIAVLRPGGFLVVSVPQKFSGYTLFKHRQMRKGLWKLGWETEFSYRRLRSIVLGLGLVEVIHAGEGYWKSWAEPAFVLSDLFDKIFRFSPVLLRGLILLPQKIHRAAWRFLENKAGHLFMKNLIIVFRKPGAAHEVKR